MIHGYHVILPHYGFWLPNDPRGSWSLFVASWELAKFGKTTRHLEQRTLAQSSQRRRACAKMEMDQTLPRPRTWLDHLPLTYAYG